MAGRQPGRAGEGASRRPLHPTSTVRVLATALALLLGGLPTDTEVVFHRRDHLDQGKYLSNQPRYNVRSYAGALVSHASHTLRSDVLLHPAIISLCSVLFNIIAYYFIDERAPNLTRK